jgi:hypothetical protein
MKHILTLVALTFALTLGACCAKQAHSSNAKSCCANGTDCEVSKPAKKK